MATIEKPDRDQLAAAIIDAYRSGDSIRDIAEQQQRSYGLVHRVLREAGVQLRTRGGKARGRTARVGRYGPHADPELDPAQQLEYSQRLQTLRRKRR